MEKRFALSVERRCCGWEVWATADVGMEFFRAVAVVSLTKDFDDDRWIFVGTRLSRFDDPSDERWDWFGFEFKGVLDRFESDWIDSELTRGFVGEIVELRHFSRVESIERDDDTGCVSNDVKPWWFGEEIFCWLIDVENVEAFRSLIFKVDELFGKDLLVERREMSLSVISLQTW